MARKTDRDLRCRQCKGTSARYGYVCLRPSPLELTLTYKALAYYQVPVKNGTTTYNVTESYTELGANSEQDGLNFQDPKIGWAIGDPPYYGLSNHQYRYALLAASSSPCVIHLLFGMLPLHGDC